MLYLASAKYRGHDNSASNENIFFRMFRLRKTLLYEGGIVVVTQRSFRPTVLYSWAWSLMVLATSAWEAFEGPGAGVYFCLGYAPGGLMETGIRYSVRPV
jgi:hypothetical protein